MLATPTKHQESAALAILCEDYLAKGGKIHRDLTPTQKRERKAWGMVAFNPKEWEENARAEFAAEDANYYIAGENTEAGYGLSETGIRIRPRKREGE